MSDIDGLGELVERNRAYRALYLAALEFCDRARAEEDAISYLDERPHATYQIQSSEALVASLIKHGGLERTILVDGQPYEGTPAELSSDDSIPEDAKIAQTLQTTVAGRAYREAHGDEARMRELFGSDTPYLPGMKLVLESCRADSGQSTRELQQLLSAAGDLGRDEKTGIELVHASYFTGVLEDAGALEWNGNRWKTTDRGSAALV